MKGELRRRTFTEAPTFGKAACPKTDPPNAEPDIVLDDDLAIDGFDFSFTTFESSPGVLMGTPAADIFSRGQVLPVYPVFNQNLVSDGCAMSGEEESPEGTGRLTLSNEKRDLRSGLVPSSSTKSLEAEDTEDPQGPSAGYCIWFPRSTPAPPSPDRQWQKSISTGSEELEFRRFRLRDLVIGRSRSDGEEKLAHFRPADKETMKGYGIRPNPTHKAAAEAEKRSKNGKVGAVKELDVVTAHRVYYGKGAGGGRRSYLPYRQNLLVGLFGNGRRRPF